MEKESPWVETQTSDFNFDGRNEVRLSNENVYALFAPHRGGMMYELDVKKITHNLLATLTRREEAYHDKVRAGQKDGDGNFGSIHDRVVFKQEGLENHLRYDRYPRKSLIDLFYDYDTNIGSIIDGSVTEHGDFVQGDYNAVIRKKDRRIQLLMTRDGVAYGKTIKISKAISLSAESNTLDIAYRFENLPEGYRLHFATELNFAGMPGGADDRYFHVNGKRYGDLSSTLDLYNTTELGLFDDWLGIDARLKVSRASNFYVFPIETVSQSEGGFELVHQSVAVQPHWYIEPDATGCWSVDFQLILDTTVAERREQSTKEFLRDAALMLVSEGC
jgi:alpha-amylase